MIEKIDNDSGAILYKKTEVELTVEDKIDMLRDNLGEINQKLDQLINMMEQYCTKETRQ